MSVEALGRGGTIINSTVTVSTPGDVNGGNDSDTDSTVIHLC
jgi:hypothetical protein